MFSFVSIPESAAEVSAVAGEGGVRLALYKMRGSRTDTPVLLFGHAAGMAAGAYLPLLVELAGFAQVFAFDARGHGGSDAPADPSAYASDLAAQDIQHIGRAVAVRTGNVPMHYVAHSMSGAAMLHLAGVRAPLFATLPWAQLLLFEPPVFPPASDPGYARVMEIDRKVTEGLRRRRRDWESPEALAAALTGRGVFRDVAADFMLAYARSALRPKDGGYTLACSPEVEAATFAGFVNPATFPGLAGIRADLPIHIVGGDPKRDPDPPWTTAYAPVIARAVGAGATPRRRFTEIPQTGHFMVQQKPAETLNLVRTAL